MSASESAVTMAGEAPTEPLYGIDVTDDGWGLAVGARGTVVELSGGQWHTRPPLTSADLRDVALSRRHGSWIVGHDGTVLHLPAGDTGGDWLIDTVDGEVDFTAVSVGTDGTVMAVGNNPSNRQRPEVTMLYDRSSGEWLSFTPEPTDLKVELFDIAVQDLFHYYVVGSYGAGPSGFTIRRRVCEINEDGLVFCDYHDTEVQSAYEGPLQAVALDSTSDELWAVGKGGLVVYEGEQRSYYGAVGGISRPLHAAAAIPGFGAVVVGAKGFAGYIRTPDEWSCRFTTGHGLDLHGVAVASESAVWVVGDGGYVARLRLDCGDPLYLPVGLVRYSRY